MTIIIFLLYLLSEAILALGAQLVLLKILNYLYSKVEYAADQDIPYLKIQCKI